MPKRKYFKRKRRKARKRFRTKRRRKRTRIPASIPQRATRRFRCVVADVLLTSTAGATNLHLIRANDPVDPFGNISGVGTDYQPIGWDQWSVFFNHYVVTGSKLTTYVSTATSDARGYTGVTLDSATLPNFTSEYYIERKLGSYRFISQPRNSQKLTCKYSTRKFFNVVDVKDNLSRLGNDVLSSPTDLAYFRHWWQAAAGASESVRATYILDLVVTFSEPRMVDRS